MNIQERYEAAERAAMRRWLREHSEPVVHRGHDLRATLNLAFQVHTAGGDPFALMESGRRRVDELVQGVPPVVTGQGSYARAWPETYNDDDQAV